jgi:hypothetical protein
MLDTTMRKQTSRKWYTNIAERDFISHNINPVLAKPTKSKLK